MTQDEIIRMAREAGEQEGEGTLNPIWEFTTEELERFAALVAAHEREACAKVVENDCHDDMTRAEEAAAIRARGE